MKQTTRRGLKWAHSLLSTLAWQPSTTVRDHVDALAASKWIEKQLRKRRSG